MAQTAVQNELLHPDESASSRYYERSIARSNLHLRRVSLENFEGTRRKPLRAVETRKDGVEAQYATPRQPNLPSALF